MIKITTLIINLFTHITRRGQGLFKLLFTIDDFFRLFAMTLLIPIFFSAIGLNDTFRVLGVILGLVIDIHDFISDFGVGKFQHPDLELK